MHPGRIDLGLGRAPGGTPLASLALQRNRSHPSDDDFLEQMAELIAWLSESFPEQHPFAKMPATPVPEGIPELWLLSSSGFSAQAAAHFGIGLCFAHFINAEGGPEAVAQYREAFRPRNESDHPHAAVAVRVICADTDAEAQRLASSTDLSRLRQRRYGEHGTLPSPEEALAYPYTDIDRSFIVGSRNRAIVGDVEHVHNQLKALTNAYAVDEVIVVTITHDHAARRHSYELLAEAFDLTPRGPIGATIGATTAR
jgi:luciferase family oxidoreductase group 1